MRTLSAAVVVSGLMFDAVKVGDLVDIPYTKALAISLDKPEK